MTAGLRLTITALPAAIALALGAAPLAAQNAVQNSQQPAPATNGVIGPSELRDFNLGAPATRNPLAVPPASTTQQSPPPAPTTQTRPTASSPPPRTAAPPSATPSAAAPVPPPRAQATPERGASQPAAANPSSSVTFALPPLGGSGASPDTTADAQPDPGSQPGLAPVPPPESASLPLNDGPPLWPWLVAALLAGSGLIYYARRQRSRVPAGAAAAIDGPQAPAEPMARAAAPMARSAPAPHARQPAPAAPAAEPVAAKGPGLIVSTRLRPRLDIQFLPERLIVDSDQTRLQFAALVLNSGNAPALDVLIEATMFNAGPAQDEAIAAFFAHPVGRGDRVAELPPLKSLTLRSEVAMPTASLRLFELEGRKLFVPLVGFNALYRWSAKEAQTSESFIVGIDTKSEKMAPFRLEGAPRQFRNVAARPHSVRLRK